MERVSDIGNQAKMKYLAHKDHSLADHLNKVGEMARKFASIFDGGEQGLVVGALHDLGKAEPEFQKRLGSDNKEGKKEPHAHHGAAIALEEEAWPAAFVINGHHAGLHNRGDMATKAHLFLDKAKKAAENLTKTDPSWTVPKIEKLPRWLDQLPFFSNEDRAIKMRAVELYSRFLFSALIDADRLDTEANAPETKENSGKRHLWRFGEQALATSGATNELIKLLNQAITTRQKTAKDKKTSEDVLKVRDDVLQACQKIAREKPRGVFTLTVPTGGGKTLASMGFALEHIAKQNEAETEDRKKLRRVIIVIPYLSIIQQTADELKNVFKNSDADSIVLEHHSQAQDPLLDKKKGKENEICDYSRERTLRQLAAENWDAPIIVTTSVQFFDSLFSRKPADARKLHNIAQSVIIFDEVQTFPPRLMQPILDVLGELTNPERPYGCSLVLCTATQPALRRSDDLPLGFADTTEIIPEPDKIFKTLKRTTYPELEAREEIPIKSWPDLAKEVLNAKDQQALVVVNTRCHARELFQELSKSDENKDAVFHLSTWMMPAHRIQVLEEVKRRLANRASCFLVSTQCIEAGVDVDFPAAWRAFGPYDAIAQAAGRCNRSGRLKPEEARVHVFRPKDEILPPGVYTAAASQTELLRKMSAADPHDPSSFETYFRLLYQLSVPDDCEIQREREQLHFETVSELFNLIESGTTPLLILRENVDDQTKDTPAKSIYEVARQRIINGGVKGYFTANDWRQIQPYVLNLDYRNNEARQALAKYASEEVFGSNLRVWGAGDAGYIGGLHGTGIILEPSFVQLLERPV